MARSGASERGQSSDISLRGRTSPWQSSTVAAGRCPKGPSRQAMTQQRAKQGTSTKHNENIQET
eukprot:3072116-Amphidinium_carterae.1